jgi:hypothetical protein
VAETDLPFDLTGCKVVKAEWPPRAFRLVLGGATAGGRPVEGARLTFEAVVNRYEVDQFLQLQRYIERGPGYIDNKIKWYPLRLPATLTCLKRSRSAKVGYGDAAFTDAYGPPPEVRADQRRYLFALSEKRFKERKPFPIICSRVALVDAKGKRLAGADTPPPRKWPTAEFERLGMRYLEAALTGDRKTAFGLLSKACQKRLGKTEFARRVAEDFRKVGWGGVDVRKIRGLRGLLYANAEDDDQIVWESVRCCQSADLPRESVRAWVELGTSFYREACYVFVVEEGGELRIDLA